MLAPAGAPAQDAPRDRLLLEELERAQRVASGQIAAEDFDWLSKGFSAFLASGGTVPLERCLRLPWRDGALRRASRDYWLRRAWQILGQDLLPWRRSEMLAAAVHAFESRQWPRWRTLQAAPADATQLDAALFYAFRCCDRIPATAMQLHNIARHRRHC